MAKINVNATTREELVEKVGLRPEVADEILRYRDEQGGRIGDIEALRDLKGVGRATLEQLRGALTFGEQVATETTRKTAELAGKVVEGTTELAGKAAEATTSTAQAGAEVTRSAADAGARVTSIGMRTVQKAGAAMGEIERETARAATAGGAAVARSVVDLLSEQAKRNLETMMELARARDPGQVVEIQSRHLQESLERLTRLTSSCFEAYRKLLASAMAASRDRLDRAA
jgi:competence ComEA-like helix-hairpin-helix protein